MHSALAFATIHLLFDSPSTFRRRAIRTKEMAALVRASALVSRSFRPPFSLAPLTRTLCAEPPADDVSGTAPRVRHKRAPKIRKPDTPHVSRRGPYLAEMSRLRKEYAAEREELARVASDAAATRRADAVAGKERRWEEKRKRSEALQPAVFTRMEDLRRVAEERRKVREASWVERNREIDARKMKRVAMLNAVAHEWITEENLEAKVDEMMDQFFIRKEAADVARRGSAHVADVVSTPRSS
jgi:hypothetical protein